jgi:hypothetical protein
VAPADGDVAEVDDLDDGSEPVVSAAATAAAATETPPKARTTAPKYPRWRAA